MVKNLPANAGDTGDVGLIPGPGRSPGAGNGNHSSVLAWRIPMDRVAWWIAVHEIAVSWTQLSSRQQQH